jgi:hypothetical protein
MSTGSQAGGSACYPTQVDAATAWCASMQGVTSAGALSCVSVSGAAQVGGSGSFSWVRRLVDSSGQVTTSTVEGQPIFACETYDFAYWSPYVVAWGAGLLAVVAARLVYRVFNERDN